MTTPLALAARHPDPRLGTKVVSLMLSGWVVSYIVPLFDSGFPNGRTARAAGRETCSTSWHSLKLRRATQLSPRRSPVAAQPDRPLPGRSFVGSRRARLEGPSTVSFVQRAENSEPAGILCLDVTSIVDIYRTGRYEWMATWSG